MYQVTLLFPSFRAFRLWCRAVDVTYSEHAANALHYNGQALGHYCPATDRPAGILATITVEAKDATEGPQP